jgi:adenylate cyclase
LGDISNERDPDGVLRRGQAYRDYRIWHTLLRRHAQISGLDLSRACLQSGKLLLPRPDGTHETLVLTEDAYFDPYELSQTKPAGGMVRLQKAYEDLRVWHLGIVLAARHLKLDLSRAIIQPERSRIILPDANGVQRVVPVNERGEFLIDWTLRLNDPRLTREPFERLLARDIQREMGVAGEVPRPFQGKLVIVGSTATGNDLSDRGATPLSKDTFLTSQYWNVANSVILGRFVTQSSPGIALLAIAALGFGAAALTWRLRAPWAVAGVLLLGAGFLALGCLLFTLKRYWLPLVLPLASLYAIHFTLISYRAFFEQNERRRIKEVFAKIVSPNVVNELLKAEKLALGGARRQVTVFFADIRGFTEMTDLSHAKAEEYVRQHHLNEPEAEAYYEEQAQEVLRTVNQYLSLIAETVKRHEGTLDKYIGDCVMAFWGAPTPNDQHALAGVRAAIEAQRAIYALNQERAAANKRREQENLERAALGGRPLPMLNLLALGTGINSGMATVGLMGSHAHILNYTVFGREVNLASRLEGFSGRGRIIIGEGTYNALVRDDAQLAATCAQLPAATVRGFRTPVKIFEVPWKPAPPQPAPPPAEKVVATT